MLGTLHVCLARESEARVKLLLPQTGKRRSGTLPTSSIFGIAAISATIIDMYLETSIVHTYKYTLYVESVQELLNEISVHVVPLVSSLFDFPTHLGVYIIRQQSLESTSNHKVYVLYSAETVPDSGYRRIGVVCRDCKNGDPSKESHWW